VLIDTHCHLDAGEFDADRPALIAAAQSVGITRCVIPAVLPKYFSGVASLAAQYDGLYYALGVHPMYVEQADPDDDLAALRNAIEQAIKDPRFVAVGEIGLDHYVEGGDRERQRWFYEQQLRLARHFDLPVILHVRRAVDEVLAGLRKFDIRQGIAHAFNGSDDQARRFAQRGVALGFGGAMTYDGSKRIRRLATELPLEAIVLETDAPDIPPQWRAGQRNEPADLRRIAEHWAGLRQLSIEQAATVTTANAARVLPRLGLV
jgi:TatD DNase family protein